MNSYNPYNLFCGSFIPNWLQKRSVKEISQGAKLCFARLCQYAGPDGNCFPKMETIAEELGVDSRTAQRYVKELTSLKLITSISQGKHQPNRYLFLKHEWMSSSKSRGDRYVHPEVTNMSPLYKKKNRKDINILSSSEKEEDKEKMTEIRESAKEVLEYLNEKATRSFRIVDSNLKGIIILLKNKTSVEQCKDVIDMKAKEWKNTDYSKYLRPATLFRASNFENYLGRVEKHIYKVSSKPKNNPIIYYQKQLDQQFPISENLSSHTMQYNKLQRDGIASLVKTGEAVLI